MWRRHALQKEIEKKRKRERAQQTSCKAEIIVASMKELKVVFLLLWTPHLVTEYAFSPPYFKTEAQVIWASKRMEQILTITFQIKRNVSSISICFAVTLEISTKFQVLAQCPVQFVRFFIFIFSFIVYDVLVRARNFLWSLGRMDLVIPTWEWNENKQQSTI